jgi:hypothetical protein
MYIIYKCNYIVELPRQPMGIMKQLLLVQFNSTISTLSWLKKTLFAISFTLVDITWLVRTFLHK